MGANSDSVVIFVDIDGILMLFPSFLVMLIAPKHATSDTNIHIMDINTQGILSAKYR